MFTSQSASNQTKYLIMVNKLVLDTREVQIYVARWKREKTKPMVSWETTLKYDIVLNI